MFRNLFILNCKLFKFESGYISNWLINSGGFLEIGSSQEILINNSYFKNITKINGAKVFMEIFNVSRINISNCYFKLIWMTGKKFVFNFFFFK